MDGDVRQVRGEDRDNPQDSLNNLDPGALLSNHGYSLTAGLLWRDRHFVMLIPLFLALPGILRVCTFADDRFLSAFSSLIVEVLRLLLVYLLASSLLSPYTNSFNYVIVRRLLFWGSVLWCFSMLPAITTLGIGLLDIVFSLVCFSIMLLFYFFFVPVICGVKKEVDVLIAAMRFANFDMYMPLRVLCTPFALSFFLVALVSDPIPSFSSMVLNEVFYGIALVLSTYGAVAFGISYWIRESDNEDNNQEILKLQIIEQQAPDWLRNSLGVNNGVLLGILALVFSVNSLSLIYSLGQDTQIKVEYSTVDDNSITLHVIVSDTPDNLRNFHPMLLSLGSENRTILSQYPVSILFDGEFYGPTKPLLSYKPSQLRSNTLKFAVRFDVDGRAEKISQLKDIHLWYATNKLQHIDLVPHRKLPLPIRHL